MQSEKIENYLARLDAELDARALNGRRDIVQEIRGHLADAAQGGEAELDAALADLGTPEELSRTYQAEVRIADALKRPDRRQLLMLILGKGRRSALATAQAVGAVALFAMSVSFVSLAFVKLVQPEGVPGVVGKFHLGSFVRTREAHEIFGWILLPVGLLLAALCFYAASHLLKRAARHLLAAYRQGWRSRPAF